MSQPTAHLNRPPLLDDMTIHAMLERERDNLLHATNFLEAICAKLLVAANGAPCVLIAEKNFTAHHSDRKTEVEPSGMPRVNDITDARTAS